MSDEGGGGMNVRTRDVWKREDGMAAAGRMLLLANSRACPTASRRAGSMAGGGWGRREGEETGRSCGVSGEVEVNDLR